MSSTATLLLSGGLLLLVLLQDVHCLSEGQPCNINVTDQCDSGLACVENGADAYCQSCNTGTPCPAVWCTANLQYTPEGQCCPVCPPPPTMYIAPSGCTVDGIHHSEGEWWETDSCTSCQCVDGEPLCSAISCQPLACTNTVQLPGECCPTCLEMAILYPAPLSTKCIVDGQERQDGEKWRPVDAGPCVRAYCDQGEVLRYSHQCDVPKCGDPVYDPDVCCPISPDVSESVMEQPEASVPTPAPVCELENGVTLKNGESHCPEPNVTAYCNAGQVEFSYHCPPLNCVDFIRGETDCDCPMCVEDAHRFQVGGRLHMSRLQFAYRAGPTNTMLKNLARDSGLFPRHINFAPCNGMICLKINVLTTNMNATESDVVEAVRGVLESKPHPGLEIGYVADFFTTTEKRSARSVEDAPYSNSKLSLSSSSSSSDRHTSMVPTAVAISASLLGVVGTVVGLALLASFVHRKNTVRTTITV